MHPTAHRLATTLTLPLALLWTGACDDDDPTGVDPAITFETSFEQTIDGFEPDTADTGDPQVDWSVERSTQRADEGTASLRIQIDNVNDQAKVWIERAFDALEPNTAYEVDVRFAFASADWGDVNLWNLFVDALPESPDAWDDFSGAVIEDTGNDASEDVGFVWDERVASLDAQTGPDGTLHVAIGVWGTWETLRTYFVDDVRVTITER